MSGENVKTDQASNQDSGAWGDFDNFAGERNINDKTGKERTFSEFDVYPRLPGESSADYGKRLKEMHQKTAEYLAEQATKETTPEEQAVAASEEAAKVAIAEGLKRLDDHLVDQISSEEPATITDAKGLRTESYLKSDFGKKELDVEAGYDRFADALERHLQEGKISKDSADRILAKKLDRSINKIDGIRQDFEDSKTVGPQEDQEAYEKWLKERSAKEEPETKEPIMENQPAEDVPKDAAASQNTEALNTSEDVINEAKERLLKELGPIIYDNVMAIIAGEVDRIFSGVKPAEQPVIESNPITEVREETTTEVTSEEGSDELRDEGDIIGDINSKRVERGGSPLTADTKKELEDVRQEKLDIKATAEANMAEINKAREARGGAPLASGETQSALDAIQQEMAGEILNTIKRHSGQIGGQNGIDILTNPNMAPEAYDQWWNSLDKAGQTTVRQILATGKEFNYTGMNQKFINWLRSEADRRPSFGDSRKAA